MTMDDTGTTEDAWVREAQQGSRSAFDALVELHGPHVLRYIQSFSANRYEAEDLSQEALLQAYRRLETFEPGTNFRGWLLKIACRTCLHARRKKQPATPIDTDHMAAIAAPDAVQEDGELDADVRRTVATLPEDQRTVVHLRFVEQLSHAEIARITESEVATVRWRLFQARQTLRKKLSAWAPESTHPVATAH
ncbi:MAG: sigma-70 family RNA polymerase sigma factor [Planctomycetota bacterium]